MNCFAARSHHGFVREIEGCFDDKTIHPTTYPFEKMKT